MLSRKPLCPSGYVIRESYQAKSGKRVSARCVRKTGLMRGKSTVRQDKLRMKASMRASKALKLSKKAGMHTPKSCPRGMTLRAGYTRKGYTRKSGVRVSHALVAPECIETQGKSGRKTRAIVLDPEDHYLSEYGYFDVENKSMEERHKSLHKLIDHFLPIKGKMATYNYVIRALNARYILNRNTNPKTARIFKQDQRAISKLYKQAKKQN